jgi:hypothetical protein
LPVPVAPVFIASSIAEPRVLVSTSASVPVVVPQVV